MNFSWVVFAVLATAIVACPSASASASAAAGSEHKARKCLFESQSSRGAFVVGFLSGAFDRKAVIGKPKAAWSASGISKHLLPSRQAGESLRANSPEWLTNNAPLANTSVHFENNTLVEMIRSDDDLHQVEIIRLEKVNGCWWLTSSTGIDSKEDNSSESLNVFFERAITHHSPCNVGRVFYDIEDKAIVIAGLSSKKMAVTEITESFARIVTTMRAYGIGVSQILVPIWPEVRRPLFALIFEGSPVELQKRLNYFTGWSVPIKSLRAIEPGRLNISEINGKAALICLASDTE